MADLKACPTCDKPRCCHCDFTPRAPGADWGYLNGPVWSDYCLHVSAMRYCDSCSQCWWRVGLEGDWDIDGCGWENCPECAAALAAEARPALAPLVPVESINLALAAAYCVASVSDEFEVTTIVERRRAAGGDEC